MAVKRQKKFNHGVEAGSMSDIMFFLLLFFLIISTLANPNVVKVPLPEAKNTDQTHNQLLTLTITSDKHYYIDKDEVLPENLESSLVAKVNTLEDKTIVVRPAFDVDVQTLIDVLQLGQKNGIKFVIATKAS
jgi:biopolymer transport protein ExbD